MIAKQVVTQDNKFVLLISEHRVDAFEYNHPLLGQMIIAPTSNKDEFNIREELLFHPEAAENGSCPRFLDYVVSPIYPAQLPEDQGMVIGTCTTRLVPNDHALTKTLCIYQTGAYSPSHAMTHSTACWLMESLAKHSVIAQDGAPNIPSWAFGVLDFPNAIGSRFFRSPGVARDYEEAVRANTGGMLGDRASNISRLLSPYRLDTYGPTPPWALDAQRHLRKHEIKPTTTSFDTVHRGLIPVYLDIDDGVVPAGDRVYLTLDALKELPERFADWVVQEPPADTTPRHNWFAVGRVYSAMIIQYGLRARYMPDDAMVKNNLINTLLNMSAPGFLDASASRSYEFAVPVAVARWHDDLMEKYSIWDIADPQSAPLGPLTLGLCLLEKLDAPDAERFSPETIFTIGQILAGITDPGITKEDSRSAETHGHDIHYLPGGRFALIDRRLITAMGNAVLPILEQAGVDLPTFLHQQADKHRTTKADPAQQRDEVGMLEQTFNEVVVAQLSTKLDAPQLDGIKASTTVVYNLLGLEAATRHMWHMVHVFRSDMYGVDKI